MKSFSKGFSIARETHQIQEQDRLCAVNGHPVQTTVEARDLILQVWFSCLVHRRREA